MEMMEQVEKILGYGPICDHCLGRFFGKRSHGLSNQERGRALRISHSIQHNLPFTPETRSCWICSDLFTRLDEWAERARISLSDIEWMTFLVGTRVPPLMAESEEMVWSDIGLLEPEPLKAEMNREVGKRISGLTAKEADFGHPDVVVILDPASDTLTVQVNPVFIRGRYCKYERGIPQTRWFCRECKGKGCPRCGYSGKMYQDSVEELIGRHVMEKFMAQDAVLHGSGREDIDACMVGSGRPFIMEVISPRLRTVDLDTLAEEINAREKGRISVTLEDFSSRAGVETIKSKQSYKKYRILVEIDGRISREELHDALNRLRGATIYQRTPRRVAHRRADRVRERRVIDIEEVGIEDHRFLIDVTGEAGLYIKELISGDEGRTEPSLAGIMARNAHVTRIDVLHVDSPAEKEESHPHRGIGKGDTYGTP
jgi:tRNA pseudouridine synthase 10